ncbi:hypothetical protein HPB49_005088 [Dermacentor silvarum]|uniref:Uncharacterized protein n=1 Tax=Dermacentor silvarum TaxID=543639 RepID=A0ACB8CVI2_DERSI|nr:hypothetical protein HPB49_005088 [Dermacentor silvarum]
MGRHLRSFTASLKLQVTEYAEEHGKREAGRKYDVDEKHVLYWIKQKDALAATNRTRKAFRGKKCKYPELEGELVKHVIDTRNDSYAVSTDMFANSGAANVTILCTAERGRARRRLTGLTEITKVSAGVGGAYSFLAATLA